MGERRHEGHAGETWWLVDDDLIHRLRELLTCVFTVHAVQRHRECFIAAYLSDVVAVREVGDWEANAIDFAGQLTSVIVQRSDLALDRGLHVLSGLLYGCEVGEIHLRVDARAQFAYFRSLYCLSDPDASAAHLPAFFPRLINALILARSVVTDWAEVERHYAHRVGLRIEDATTVGTADFAAALLDRMHDESPAAPELLATIADQLAWSEQAKAKILELGETLCDHYGIPWQFTLGKSPHATPEAKAVALSLQLEFDPGNGYLVTAYRFDAEHRGSVTQLIAPLGSPSPESWILDPTDAQDRQRFADAVHRTLNEGGFDDAVCVEVVLADEPLMRDELVPESWRCDISIPLGCRWPLVLRSEAVFLSKGCRSDTRRHWERVAIEQQAAVSRSQGTPRFSKAMLLIDDHRCLHLEHAAQQGRGALFRNPPCQDPDEVHQLRSAVGHGVSVAIWPRRWPAGRCFATELAERLGRCKISELPSRLLALRQRIRDEHRNHESQDALFLTALLWDNPNRRRPTARLSAPGRPT